MIYQFLPSLTAAAAGVSACVSSAADAAAACSESSDSISAESSRSAVSSVWVVSSSAMCRLLRKRVEQLIDQAEENLIDHRKIRREREHRDYYYQSSRAHLLPGGPRHAPHFGLQLFEIVLDADGPSRDALEKIPLLAFLGLCNRHSLFPNSGFPYSGISSFALAFAGELAGAEGFEPPKAVLETAGLPLAYAPTSWCAFWGPA